ncbi:unnamed protein product [Allacma fusca]|uniref:Uncharacterized protein n=1 Tax=Allacma fusca TaxID=39272 RepID=A0A8J2NQJ7_9HEXA|nr:unnamed protein product [Allacma fusca]
MQDMCFRVCMSHLALLAQAKLVVLFQIICTLACAKSIGPVFLIPGLRSLRRQSINQRAIIKPGIIRNWSH